MFRNKLLTKYLLDDYLISLVDLFADGKDNNNWDTLTIRFLIILTNCSLCVCQVWPGLSGGEFSTGHVHKGGNCGTLTSAVANNETYVEQNQSSGQQPVHKLVYFLWGSLQEQVPVAASYQSHACGTARGHALCVSTVPVYAV